MSDIFISYKREDQPVARKLADALESEGWTVWWDPKLRAGERFNDVIEKGLKESKCVVVMWSKRSVESQYVKHEANYALRRNKLVPVMIEEVELPFRFEDLHTLSLLDWDGSRDFSEFRRLVNDISTILGPSPAATAEEHRRQGEAQRKAEEADLPEQEREEEARRNANEDERIWRRWVEQQETEHTRVEAEVKRQGEDKRLREREKQRAEEETKRKANDENRSKDITALVVDYVANEFKKEHGVDLRNDSLALQRLKEAVEKAMRELSSIRETEINLPFITANATGPKHLNMKLTRVKLESFIEEVRRQTTRTYPSPLEFDTFVRNATTNESIRIVGITVTNKSENRLQYCSVRIEKIQPSEPDSRYWIFSDSKIARPLPTEEVFGLNPLDHRDVPIAQLDSINSRFENLGIELLCYSTQEYPALDLEQCYVLTIRGSAEIGTPIERDYKLWVDGLKQLCFKAVNAGSTASC